MSNFFVLSSLAHVLNELIRIDCEDFWKVMAFTPSHVWVPDFGGKKQYPVPVLPRSISVPFKRPEQTLSTEHGDIGLEFVDVDMSEKVATFLESERRVMAQEPKKRILPISMEVHSGMCDVFPVWKCERNWKRFCKSVGLFGGSLFANSIPLIQDHVAGENICILFELRFCSFTDFFISQFHLLIACRRILK